jgi:hypothetical protein
MVTVGLREQSHGIAGPVDDGQDDLSPSLFPMDLDRGTVRAGILATGVGLGYRPFVDLGLDQESDLVTFPEYVVLRLGHHRHPEGPTGLYSRLLVQ